MESSVYLHSFVPVIPRHHLPQNEIVDWILKSHERTNSLTTEEVQLKTEALRRFCLSEDYIKERFYECADVDEEWEKHSIYKITPESPYGVDIFERNKFFDQRAKEIFARLYDHQENPDHLIHVTCTGYVSPSPAQRFFQQENPSPDITHAYHMGCYASLPSVRMAQALIGSGVGRSKVDIVHTEMCSLHLDPSHHTPEQMVVQTLFADGHIKYSAGHDPVAGSFRILGVKEELVPDSCEDMTWIPSSHGMRMTLSREVPGKIGEKLMGFVEALCQECGHSFEEVRREGIFAIHPGGPKIISAVQQKLELREEQVAASKFILKTRGNMSSATLPHVWNEILNNKPQDKQLVLSLAFGPGLTIIGSLFEVKA